MDQSHQVPIKVVAHRTGLSPHIIRMWERRYACVAPHRSTTNRRMYSEEDIERFRLLRLATESGHRISEVATLTPARLRELVQTDVAGIAPRSVLKGTKQHADTELQGLWEMCLDSVKRLDARGLQLLLAQSSVAHSQTSVLEKLIVPLMEEIGNQWRDGSLRPAHEHLASAIVRSFLSNISTVYHVHEAAPVALATTPIGQLHEIGALLATAAAAAEGWSVTYLGPNLPAEDIVAASKQASARAIVMSIVYPEDDPRVGIDLRRIRQLAGNEVALLLGGRAAPAYSADIQAVNGHLIRNLDQLRDVLRTVRAGKPSST
jgi:DNA-binding transcriptional MerR regulator/methylmalonyl-CoA mutase cobalamin-binding subunit